MHTILHTQYTDTTNIYAAHTPQQYRTQIQQYAAHRTQNRTTPVQHSTHAQPQRTEQHNLVHIVYIYTILQD